MLKHAPAWTLLGAIGVHPEHTLITAARLARLKSAGALVNTWTVNDPERAEILAKLGVDAIITDTPGAVLSRLNAPVSSGPEIALPPKSRT